MKRFSKITYHFMDDCINSIVIVLIILLFWALVPINPYSYYILLRVIMFIFNLILSLKIDKQNRKIWLLIFIFISFLYNPIFPIHLNRAIWSIINIATIIIYLTYLYKILRNKEK